MATEQNKRTNNVLMQGSILAAASVIVRLIGLVYRVPMAKILGDTAMGYYGNAYEFYNIALLLSSYSLPLAVSKLVSAREVQGQHSNSRKVFTLAMAFGAVVGGIATAVCFFGARVYAQIIKVPGVIIPLQVLAPTIFVFSIMGVIRGYFQGHNNMVPTAISQILEQIVNAVVSVGASWWMMRRYNNDASYGAAGGTLGTLSGACAAFLSLLVIYAIYRKTFLRLVKLDRESEEHTPERSVHVLKLIVITVVPVVISQTVYQVSGIIDNVVFNLMMDHRGVTEVVRSAYLGIYTGKYRLLTNVPVAVASALGTAIVPGLVADYVRGRTDEVKEKVASAVKFNMIIAFPCAVGMSMLSRPILLMLFDDSNPVSRNMLLFGSVAIIVFALSTLTNGILQGINHLNTPVVHSAIALVIHVVILVGLLRYTGLGAYALVVGNVSFALIVSILNWRAIGKFLAYKQEIRTTFVIPALASLIMGSSVLGVFYLLNTRLGVTISCTAAIFFGVFVYFAALIFLGGVTKDELLRMPKGALLVKVLSKLHMLR